MIERPLYIEKIVPFLDSPFVKILTGVRRSGKSTILEAVAQLLLARGVAPDNIIHARLDSYEYEKIADGSGLYHYMAERMTDAGARYHLLLDEVQEVPDWEKAVNDLVESRGANVIVTGSNSKLMSSELSTYLTGRYIMIPVYTLSFGEYMDFRASVNDIRDKYDMFRTYLHMGGFPAVTIGNYTEQQAYSIVHDIYNSIVYNDITKRNAIRKTDLFERIVRFVFENVGKSFSARSVCDYLKSENRSVDIETVYNYIGLLKKAYIVYQADRYNIQGKSVMKTHEKYYLADPSLKFSVLGFSEPAISSMLENIVFLEFLRRGFVPNIGCIGDKEIDFVATMRDKKVYVQVCRQLPDTEHGRERELGNLRAINDNFPKYVVTLDEYATGNDNGIHIIHIADFLLKEDW